jgi:signal transduction histidine kinase
MKRLLRISFAHIRCVFGLLLFCFACCIPFSIQAQTRIEIPPDSQWTRTLIDELEVIGDEQRVWSAELLFATSDDLFEPNTVDAKPTLHNYWARFELANATESEQWVSFESHYWDHVTLYFRDSSGNVTMIPFGILSSTFDTKFLTQPQTAYDVLANFESNGQFRRENNINLIIKSTLSALEKKTFVNYLDGITFGIMFGLALYNLFLFLSLRDRTYFWYTLYILFFAFSFITLFISTPPKWTQFFFPDNPLFGFYLKKIADPILWISYTNFVRLFLATKLRHPGWDKILKACIALIILQFLINLTGILQFSGVSRSFSWNLSVIISVSVAIVSYIKGYTRAKFFLVGQFFLIIGLVVTSMYYADMDIIAFLPKTEFFNYFRAPTAVYACAAAESIIFSFALADKYNILQQDIVAVKLKNEKEKQDFLATQNKVLEQQVSAQTQELRQSLEHLQTTQAQLIQAEKMASLGTLTAGIAHEIQNPLNFINNFSEINIELVEELIAESTNESGDDKEDTESETLRSVKKNSEKIYHHGNRVSAIVKGMLQHSRTGSSHYEEVDINALSDESMRLAYHAFRAREKSFNAEYVVELGSNLPQIRAIPQDLGRVILNIINNAFYAVHEKRKAMNDGSNDPVEYQPRVKLTTSESLQDICITIADNGPGIPDEILNKIFQPFFTTKPAGAGTGLGLSLSYDIITKGHGGELKVRSKDGLGSEFEIILPINKRT